MYMFREWAVKCVFLISLSLLIYSTWYWGKIFKNGPIKICGRQPLKIWCDLLKAVFYKFHWVYSWILCPIYSLHTHETDHYQNKYWFYSLENNLKTLHQFCFNFHTFLIDQEKLWLFLIAWKYVGFFKRWLILQSVLYGE